MIVVAGIPTMQARRAAPRASRGSAACCAAIAALLVSPTANAYWELVPDVRTGGLHETNPRNLVDNERDASGGYLDVRLPVTWETATSQFQLAPRVRLTEYLESRNDDMDSDNYYLTLGYTRGSLRARWGVNASYDDTDVRSSEFVSATPDDPDAEPLPDGGFGRFIFPDDRRDSWSVSPFWEYALTERNSVNAVVSTSDTTYDQESRTTFFDYTYDSAQLTFSHALDLQSALLVTAAMTEFDAEHPVRVQGFASHNITNSRSLQIGYQREITPTISAEANVGTSRSTVRLDGPQFNDPLTTQTCFPLECRFSDENFVGDVSIRKRSERTTLNFGLSRATAPRSDGTETIRDSVSFYVQRRLTERLSGSVGVVYLDESTIADLARLDRQYVTADLNARWRLSETWWVSGTYTYRTDEYERSGAIVEGDAQERENNRVVLSIEYRGLGVRW